MSPVITSVAGACPDQPARISKYSRHQGVEFLTLCQVFFRLWLALCKKASGNPRAKGLYLAGMALLGKQGQGELGKTSAPSGGNIGYKNPEQTKPSGYPSDWKSSLININLGLKFRGGSEPSIIFILEKSLIRRLQSRAS